MPCAVKQPPSLEADMTATIPQSQEGHDSYPINLPSKPKDASQQEKKLCVGMKDSLKNKSPKKTTISEGCPCNEEERERLKRNWKATMFAHLTLPHGHPKKAANKPILHPNQQRMC